MRSCGVNSANSSVQLILVIRTAVEHWLDCAQSGRSVALANSRKQTFAQSVVLAAVGGFLPVRLRIERADIGHSAHGKSLPRAERHVWDAQCGKADDGGGRAIGPLVRSHGSLKIAGRPGAISQTCPSVRVAMYPLLASNT